jgi:hypothetical protein
MMIVGMLRGLHVPEFRAVSLVNSGGLVGSHYERFVEKFSRLRMLVVVVVVMLESSLALDVVLFVRHHVLCTEQMGHLSRFVFGVGLLVGIEVASWIACNCTRIVAY